MALFLHRMVPGSALGLVCGLYAEDGEECFVAGHAAVVLDPGRPLWLDVDGVHEGIDPTRFRFDRPVDSVALRPASEDEVRYAFAAMEGTSDEEIEAARRLWQDDDALAAAVERARDEVERMAESAPGDGSRPGWQPLQRVARDALFLLSGDLDDDEIERVSAMSVAGQVRHFFSSGECDAFAAALHEMTGWPVVTLSNARGLPYHRLVAAPDGRLLDSHGWTDATQLARRYGLRKPKLSAPGGLELCVGLVDDDPEALSGAVSAIRRLPWPPFDEAWFREISQRTFPGVDEPETREPPGPG
jgi:hypothetical protein